jgi:hypothetical protein
MNANAKKSKNNDTRTGESEITKIVESKIQAVFQMGGFIGADAYLKGKWINSARSPKYSSETYAEVNGAAFTFYVIGVVGYSAFTSKESCVTIELNSDFGRMCDHSRYNGNLMAYLGQSTKDITNGYKNPCREGKMKFVYKTADKLLGSLEVVDVDGETIEDRNDIKRGDLVIVQFALQSYESENVNLDGKFEKTRGARLVLLMVQRLFSGYDGNIVPKEKEIPVSPAKKVKF